MISVVINTCALGAHAGGVLGSDGRTVPHSQRAYVLRNLLLPLYLVDPHIDEVVVAGEWEPGPGYRYVNIPSRYKSSADALAQRQAGFDASQGDVVVFQHDDHILLPGWWAGLDSRADVLVPERWTRLRSPFGEQLNNGAPDYISGHCAIYKRKVLERCPWRAVPAVREWDIKHTEQIVAAGFAVRFTDTLRAWDIEHGATPWL